MRAYGARNARTPVSRLPSPVYFTLFFPKSPSIPTTAATTNPGTVDSITQKKKCWYSCLQTAPRVHESTFLAFLSG